MSCVFNTKLPSLQRWFFIKDNLSIPALKPHTGFVEFRLNDFSLIAMVAAQG
jgi:hypothetical protein